MSVPSWPALSATAKDWAFSGVRGTQLFQSLVYFVCDVKAYGELRRVSSWEARGTPGLAGQGMTLPYDGSRVGLPDSTI